MYFGVIGVLLFSILLYFVLNRAPEPIFAGGWGTTPVTGTFWQTTQPVSGTVTATNTVMVSDTIYMDSMAINPYTETTKALTGVKQLELQALTGIDVRVAIGTGSSTSTTYRRVFAGDKFILKNLNAIAVTIAALGNDVTAADTGTLNVTYTK